MEEKIRLQPPKPFSSGFLLSFNRSAGGAGGPAILRYTFQVGTIEYLKEIRRLAFYLKETDRPTLQSLEQTVVAQMVQKNAKWFNNDLQEADIRARFSSTLQPDGHLLIRASPSHPPKTMSLNDHPVADLQTLVPLLSDMVFSTVTLACHGVYLQKSHYELLWKIEAIHIYRLTEHDILQTTNIDEYKEDIESQCEADLLQLKSTLDDEIAQWEKTMRQRKSQWEHLKTLLDQCRQYPTSHPEWNKTLEYIQGEIVEAKKNYFI